MQKKLITYFMQKKYEMIIKENIPNTEKSISILEDGQEVGYGFETDTGRVGLLRCADCGRENYALNVMSGICTWCGWKLIINK